MPGRTNSADEMIRRINAAVKKVPQKVRMAQDSILIEMVNWIKDNHTTLGGWGHVTGNLEKSIDYNPSVVEGGKVIGYLKAGMEYAPYVEFREGHWVLSGAINSYRDFILAMIVERIKAQ